MRLLLREFADGGGTVLLSSHLLHEVEATADRLVVIGAGRIVAQGHLAELLGARGVTVRGLDPAGLHAALVGAGLAVRFADGRSPDGGLVADAEAVAVGRAAQAAGQVLVELSPGGTAGLEELFFSLTASPSTTPSTSTTPSASTTPSVPSTPASEKVSA
jgi:ABC-2 type transport system ATP-binding protein